MRILYLDLVGGISGDMLVGALVDLGVPLDLLRDALAQTGVPEVVLRVSKDRRHEITGTRFHVATSAPSQGAAQRVVSKVAGSVQHIHRPFREIRQLLANSSLKPNVRDAAQRVFQRLAEAEGAVHGVAPDDVEFHEVGSWDSIADVVCAVTALDHLAVGAVYCSPVPLGSGTARSAHGVIPVPGPATLHLLRGFPVVQGGPAFERTTPTGAALLAALAQPAPQPFAYVPERVGIGLGTANPPEVANLLRAVLGTVEAVPTGVAVETIESAAANVDDANPEWIGFAMEQLFAAGALDVTLVPIQMKKNRPGTQIQVLYAPALRQAVLTALLRHVPTLGVRYQTWQRWALPRRPHTVRTVWGEIAGKVSEFEGRARFTPEFEACRAAAQGHNVPLPEIYRAAQRAWEDEQA